ncbi:YdcF family protein [Methylobacterium sp. J-072]|uniref:YdcF family protein n=1 Tax=Methylobacterium sp. J-072 TaxID=2836651 RepID=UPI001FBBA3BD|nr:YdcF family protein [Methylobacterium sp. J-072]MCJ2096813.1 YdcF family protein [Methylobacterium sp. J-072]
MFLALSKVTYFLVTPSNVFIFLGLIGFALLMMRRRAAGIAFGAFGLLGLLLGGLTPLSALILLPLEQRFAAYSAADRTPPTGIIVLGGAIMTGVSEARGQIVVNDAAERQIYFADLARRFPDARLVFTGGSGVVGGGTPEADIVSREADAMGLPRSRLILENRSRNTYENATFSAALVQPKPGEHWLLVTSAWHMPRAIGCFRQAGFTVDAFPVDYRTRGWIDTTRFKGFASDGLLQLDLAVKEWIGLAVYRLAGYTSDWLPGPEPEAAPGSASR